MWPAFGWRTAVGSTCAYARVFVSSQANDNLRFLTILKPTCDALAKASAQEIAGLMPELLSRIRVIGAVSRFYWTDERLAGLLRKVSNEVIRRCTANVDVAQVRFVFVLPLGASKTVFCCLLAGL